MADLTDFVNRKCSCTCASCRKQSLIKKYLSVSYEKTMTKQKKEIFRLIDIRLIYCTLCISMLDMDYSLKELIHLFNVYLNDWRHLFVYFCKHLFHLWTILCDYELHLWCSINCHWSLKQKNVQENEVVCKTITLFTYIL